MSKITISDKSTIKFGFLVKRHLGASRGSSQTAPSSPAATAFCTSMDATLRSPSTEPWPPTPPWWQERPRRTARERRAQASRASGRFVQSLLHSFKELEAHRGCRTTKLGAALAALLKEPAPQAATSKQTAVQTVKEAAAQTEDLKDLLPVPAEHTENDHVKTSAQTEEAKEAPSKRKLKAAEPPWADTKALETLVKDPRGPADHNYEKEAEPRLAATRMPTGLEEPAQAEEP